jgi:hypothetical protein
VIAERFDARHARYGEIGAIEDRIQRRVVSAGPVIRMLLSSSTG